MDVMISHPLACSLTLNTSLLVGRHCFFIFLCNRKYSGVLDTGQPVYKTANIMFHITAVSHTGHLSPNSQVSHTGRHAYWWSHIQAVWHTGRLTYRLSHIAAVSHFINICITYKPSHITAIDHIPYLHNGCLTYRPKWPLCKTMSLSHITAKWQGTL